MDYSLADQIRLSKSTEDVVRTTLKTDERVIARVTDGIYRQPASAIRELISNAYDADATRVVIRTDMPRFERISIEDNGHGMEPEVLAHLLQHIGGSAKRTEVGKELGITALNNSMQSPKGRRLIGKIGIGLFSVSQLTHTFQVITKVAEDDHRTIATVALRQYADDDHPPGVDPKSFESGKVNIWREKATDTESHGTTIILNSIRPQARDTLRSREIWASIEQNESLPDHQDHQIIEPPRFHIGRVDSTEELFQSNHNGTWSLPWDLSDEPSSAFSKLVQSVWDEIDFSTPNPQLARMFDYYLRMVWQLSLAVPLPYFEGHLFDMDLFDWAEAFMLSNLPKGSAEQINLTVGKSLRQLVGLSDSQNSIGTFDIFFDDLKLARPLKFRGLPTTNNALKKPLVFIGKCREEFKKVPRSLSGGTLEFEAYLMWTPKVAPTEHQGSLIRIHGSSGTLFDSTFMRYQVSEQTRLRQVTCEIFVREGLDSALNIDRESFNNAHPHAVFITKWLHGALRQLATQQKKSASEVREVARDESMGIAALNIQLVATNFWKEEHKDPGAMPPTVELSASGQKSKTAAEAYVFAPDVVIPARATAKTSKAKARERIIEEKLKAIAQLLASLGLLDAVPKRKQEKLLKAIYEILDLPDQ